MLKRIYRAIPLLAVAALATPAGGSAQDLEESGAESGSPAPAPRLRVGLLTGDVRIDGRLDDEAWGGAPVASGFVQGEPVEGVPAEHDTQVRVLVDGDALYIGARMFDDDPSGIGTQLVRRDEKGAYDWFTVALDPNLDRRTGYTFQVSAAGVQSDQYLYNDQRMDDAWDAVWESAVTVDADGWVAEIRIPLSQIRFESSDDPQEWGVNFARRRIASNELSYFALKSRLREGLVSQFGRLTEVEVPNASRRIEVRPYVLSSYHRGPAEVGNPFFDGQEQSNRIGGDLRLGLGPAFTVDATVNPDFGQVEADPAVINLSEFETFFQERRPFFVEDAQVFDFTLSGHQNQLFYTRRIGRQPQGGAPSGSRYRDVPDAATIMGAAKLTGRTSSGLSIGALTAVTEGERGRALLVGADGSETLSEFLVEPRSTFGVVRAQQDLNGGASQVGAIATVMSRDLPADGSFDFLTSEAFSGGVNFEHQWNDRDWSLTGYFAGSHVRGDARAITRIQRAGNHYFQRPDASRLSVDSTATSMTGAEWRLTLSRQNGQHWTGSIWAAEGTKGFEINDVGFSNARERLDAGFRVGYREIRPGSVFRNYSLNFFSFHNWSHEALDDATSWSSWQDAYVVGSFSLNTRATLLNYWGGDVNLSYSPDHWNFGLTRGGPATKDPGSVNLRANLHTDGRKAVSYRGSLNVRRGFDESGDQFTVSGTVSVRPTPSLEMKVEPKWSRQSDAAQYVTSTSTLAYEPTFGRRYLFGELERTTVSMETRLNWTFSPKLSLQLFAQPLLSSGDYVAYKQLQAARTYDFDEFSAGDLLAAGDATLCQGGRICEEVREDGSRVQHLDFDGDGTVDYQFGDRDFNVRSLIGNAVLRWEYRPGSTIFFVWQRQQAGRIAMGDFDFGRDLGALFDAPAENRFIVKVNYWLGL